MLDFIPPSSLTYDDWLAVGMALKNIGCDCADWEQWSRSDDRFKDGECESKWNGFNRDGYDIGTIFIFAEPNGYDAKETYREWYDLHPSLRPSAKRSLIIDSKPDELKGAKPVWSGGKFSDYFKELLIIIHRLQGRARLC
ncbi:MAG: PriCT-2 domain-containing protein [Selenomonadaceae bacterium]|nr:PriCT-2 domain-containing protein [Selenomonadaceae bacterium]